MPEYFRHFPQVKHSGRDVTDITKRIAFFDRVAKDPRVFLPYTVEEGMKAEDVAYYYYDDPGYVWLVYLANNIIDPYSDWPLDQNDLERYIEEKYVYSCAECAIATTSVFDEVKATFLILLDAHNKKFKQDEIAIYSSNYAEAWSYITLNLTSEYIQSVLFDYYTALDSNNVSYSAKEITDASVIYDAINVTDIFGDMPEQLRRIIVRIPNKDVLKKEFNVLNWSRAATSNVKNIVHYVNKEDPDFKISTETYTINTSENKLDQDFFAGDWNPVRVYDYEFQANEDKRHIFLVDRNFKSLTTNELKSLMANG